jgi:hypothetical protein
MKASYTASYTLHTANSRPSYRVKLLNAMALGATV